MNVNLTKKGTVAVISVQGRVDTMSAPGLEQKVSEWISEGETRLILDLTDMDYISSAGLRTLIVVGKKAKAQGGFLWCCALQGVVGKVFEVSGFPRLIPVYASVDEALGAL